MAIPRDADMHPELLSPVKLQLKQKGLCQGRFAWYRAVRAEACRVQQALAESLKRRMAPVLKSVIGPWWMAQHDTASEVATSARDSFQAAFPGTRHQEALSFCASDVSTILSPPVSQPQWALEQQCSQ